MTQQQISTRSTVMCFTGMTCLASTQAELSCTYDVVSSQSQCAGVPPASVTSTVTVGCPGIQPVAFLSLLWMYAGFVTYAGAVAAWNGHAVPKHQVQRQLPLSSHRPGGCLALGTLVCQLSRPEHSALPPAPRSP